MRWYQCNSSSISSGWPATRPTRRPPARRCARTSHRSRTKMLIDPRLAQPAQQVGIDEVPLIAGPDANAGLGAQLDQPFGGQHFDRFSQDRPAHVKMAAQVSLGRQGRVALADGAPHDAQGNFPGHLVVQALARDRGNHRLDNFHLGASSVQNGTRSFHHIILSNAPRLGHARTTTRFLTRKYHIIRFVLPFRRSLSHQHHLQPPRDAHEKLVSWP